jgi:hypothetical protein
MNFGSKLFYILEYVCVALRSTSLCILQASQCFTWKFARVAPDLEVQPLDVPYKCTGAMHLAWKYAAHVMLHHATHVSTGALRDAPQSFTNADLLLEVPKSYKFLKFYIFKI